MPPYYLYTSLSLAGVVLYVCDVLSGFSTEGWWLLVRTRRSMAAQTLRTSAVVNQMPGGTIMWCAACHVARGSLHGRPIIDRQNAIAIMVQLVELVPDSSLRVLGEKVPGGTSVQRTC